MIFRPSQERQTRSRQKENEAASADFPLERFGDALRSGMNGNDLVRLNGAPRDRSKERAHSIEGRAAFRLCGVRDDEPSPERAQAESADRRRLPASQMLRQKHRARVALSGNRPVPGTAHPAQSLRQERVARRKGEHAVDRLNAFGDLDECMIYITENFDWNPNSDGAKLLVDLLERKLA